MKPCAQARLIVRQSTFFPRAAAARLLALFCFAAASVVGHAHAAPDDDAAALIAKAREAQSREDKDGALQALNAAIAKDPENQEARKLRGDLHFSRGDLDKAMADYAELRPERTNALGARTAPRPPPTELFSVAFDHLRIAGDAMAKGDLDSALNHYNIVLAMDVPYDYASSAVQNRGNIYRRQRDDERALRDYEQAIRLNPRNAGAYVNRGVILADRGDHEAAIQDFDEAIRFNPKLPEAFYNRAMSFAANNDWESATRDFNEAVQLEPDSAVLRAGRGELFLAQKKLKEARADFQAALRIDRKSPAAWLGLARLEYQAQHFTTAGAHLDKLIALQPDVPMALNLSAWLRATAPIAAARNGQKAVKHALRTCELTRWNQFAYVDTLAAAYAEKGDFDKAVDYQWYALSLIDTEAEESNRAEAEERLRLFEKRRKYREAKPREEPRESEPAKGNDPEVSPTPPLSRRPGGRVGMSSPPLPRNAGRADFRPALVRSCA